YRWGQSVSISASPATNSKFTTWSQTSGTTSSFASSATASTTFTMPTSAATIYADGYFGDNTMQGFTLAKCKSEASSTNKTLTDFRDSKTYAIRYIGSICWMVQNLRYIVIASDVSGKMTLSATTSNINSDVVLSYEDLTQGNSTTIPRLHVNTASDVDSAGARLSSYYAVEQVGVLYNYAAASGGYISSSSSTIESDYSICPKNWRLPTRAEAETILSYQSLFQPIYGGFYMDGSYHNIDTSGDWWTSTASTSYSRYFLRYDKLNDPFSVTYDTGQGRNRGFRVRCVRTS
ncbi:hypothetical protein IJ135_00945, partial [Candidatus Saccharibacteria bacterium]|nr:hypothetical protein [Candidatus Saccharibacteria bacterium]